MSLPRLLHSHLIWVGLRRVRDGHTKSFKKGLLFLVSCSMSATCDLDPSCLASLDMFANLNCLPMPD